MSSKPKFDPSKPYETSKPKFDPTKPYEATGTQNEPTYDNSGPGMLQSAALGGGQALTAGFQDELAGLVGSHVVDPVASRLIPGYENNSYDQSRDYFRGQNKSAEEANPWSYGLAMVPGSLLSAPLLPELGSAKATAAALGALNGAGYSEAPTALGVGKDAAIGAVLTRLLNPVVEGAGSFLKSKAERVAGRALGAGAKMAPEEVDKLGRWSLNNKINKAWSGPEATADRIDEAVATAGKQMEKAHTLVDAQGKFISPKEVAENVTTRWMTPGRVETGATMDPAVTNLITRPEAELISTQGAQSLKNELGEMAKFNLTSSPGQRNQARLAYNELKNTIENTVESKLGGPALENYQAAKQNYGMGSQAEELFNKKLGREAARPSVGLTDLVAAADSNPAHYAVKKGAMALTRPTQTLASGLEGAGNILSTPKLTPIESNTVGYLLSKFPNALGNYAPILQKASEQGGPGGVEAAHKYLLQTDPGYGQILNGVKTELQSNPGARTTLRQSIESDPNLSPVEKANQLSKLNSGNF